MKKELMEILVCPVCKSKFTLKVETEKNDEVVTGALCCESCVHEYPIADGIPNLLPPE